MVPVPRTAIFISVLRSSHQRQYIHQPQQRRPSSLQEDTVAHRCYRIHLSFTCLFRTQSPYIATDLLLVSIHVQPGNFWRWRLRRRRCRRRCRDGWDNRSGARSRAQFRSIDQTFERGLAKWARFGEDARRRMQHLAAIRTRTGHIHVTRSKAHVYSFAVPPVRDVRERNPGQEFDLRYSAKHTTFLPSSAIFAAA